MQHIIIHTSFDFLALAIALLSGWLTIRYQLLANTEQTASKIGKAYFLYLSLGSIIGAYLFGTLNLMISETEGIGRSIIGSLLGATLTVELYKFLHKRHQGHSTGYIYVIPFCLLVAIGRLGCLFSGLDDHTYGTITTLPWGWDFGDGISRHPVQLYESLSMLSFAVFSIILLKRRKDLFVGIGYYLCVGFYAAQRFAWEFLKPYSTLMLNLNLFHFVALALILYSTLMILQQRHSGLMPHDR